MFLRIKKRVNGSGRAYEYAYWVGNMYQKQKKRSKQKVKQYLGRVYRFEKVHDQKREVIDAEKTAKENIIELIENELKNYGFEQKEGWWQKEQCRVSIEQARCLNSQGKDVCIALNDGLIHTLTLGQLMAFKPKESMEKAVGKQLANALVSAGIKPKEAVFIGLFRQIIQEIHR